MISVAIYLELLFSITLLALCLKQNISRNTIFINSKKNKAINLIQSTFNNAGYAYSQESVKRLVLNGLIVSSMFGFIFSFIWALVMPCLLMATGLIYLRIRTKREATTYLDDACYALSRLIRSGCEIDNAITNLAKNEDINLFNKLNQLINNGYSLENAIAKELASVSPEEKIICAALSIALITGGSSAIIFDRIGDAIHQKSDLKSDINSSMSQVKLSSLIISLLPIALLILASVTGSSAFTFLFTSPLGILCLLLGLLLELIGIFWMKKIVYKVHV